MRISGSCASLAGLEKALQEDDEEKIELAIRRILLIHSVILSIGGIPLIYLGDEVGTLNDYGYREEPSKADDTRWVHRPIVDWEKMARRTDERTVEGRVYNQLRHLIRLRKEHPVLAGGGTEIVEAGNPHIFGYVRQREGHRLLALANFSEREQPVAGNELRLYGLDQAFTDLVSGEEFGTTEPLVLPPYGFVWLRSRKPPTSEI
jgi:glycosidase